MVADKLTYLSDICNGLMVQWPENRAVNIVCHGHSVPAGYFATPYVNTFAAYPYLLHKALKQRFHYAVINVIVTAVGGENSQQGAGRFAGEALCHRPDVLTLDYGLNDRQITLQEAERAWRSMIEAALEKDVKLILLTPSWEQSYFLQNEDWEALLPHVSQIRGLAAEYGTGLVDTFALYQRHIDSGGELQDLISYINHPNEAGHKLIANSLAQWFYCIFELE